MTNFRYESPWLLVASLIHAPDPQDFRLWSGYADVRDAYPMVFRDAELVYVLANEKRVVRRDERVRSAP